mgnify:CR=1 FL=1|jgi:hypothetical protein
MSNQQGLITFTLNKNGLKNGTHNKIIRLGMNLVS